MSMTKSFSTKRYKDIRETGCVSKIHPKKTIFKLILRYQLSDLAYNNLYNLNTRELSKNFGSVGFCNFYRNKYFAWNLYSKMLQKIVYRIKNLCISEFSSGRI